MTCLLQRLTRTSYLLRETSRHSVPETRTARLYLSQAAKLVKHVTEIHHRCAEKGPSHYCEKARWALERARVAFKETKHAVFLHMFFTKGLGVGTSCPKAVMGRHSEKVVLQDSSDILQFADKNIKREEDWLYPFEDKMQKLVQSWEVKLDTRLGPHVRRWAYCYLLFDKCSYHLVTQGASLLERVITWVFMPFLRRVIYRALLCDKPSAKENSLKVIQKIFQEVDETLADGRPFICGTRFTAADLTFAALAGPMVNPPGYGPWNPPLEEVPKEMRETQLQLRKTLAGQHILKMYETERYRILASKM